jgi:transcriptional regulator with GAF, ATPase, and Fis domain
MYKTILIVALCLIGIFVHPFDPGIMDFVYRFIVFSIIVYLVYNVYQQSGESENRSQEQFFKPVPTSIKDEFTISDEWHLAELIDGDDRTKQYLNDQFDILAGLMFPDSGWIFYKDGNNINVVTHKNLSNNPIPNIQVYYPISGLIQILDEKDNIVIENNIDIADNLLPFYKDVDYSVKSFLGLPITFQNREKIFYVFDSHHAEHFNKDDTSLFVKLAENTSTWILNRVKAYNLLSNTKNQTKLLNFCKDLNGSKTISSAIEKFSLLISNEFEATRLTISLLKKDKNVGVIKKVIGQKDDFDENTEFTLDDGLTGWIISKQKPYLIDDLEKGDYFIPRYSKNEKSNFGFRSFLGVPIVADNQIFGAVTLEHRLANKFEENDKFKIIDLVEIFSTIFLRTSATHFS